MFELMIHLENDSKKPLYEQIYTYIRENIADGKISYGEKLPSTRFLSKYLQVSRSTVELAYEQLLSEGYIESEPCRGYFVSDISKLYHIHIERENKEKEYSIRKKQQQSYKIVFSPNQNEMQYFPYNAWRKLSKEILAENNPDLFLAGEAAGEIELREAICNYIYHARGVNCIPDQIIVGAGNEYLLILLAQVLGSGRSVAIENPTYLQAYRTLQSMEYTMLAVGSDENGLSIEEIRVAKPDIIYTMPSHQFPMGMVMPMKRRLELLHWAAEKEDRYIIEDDHDSEFRYKGKPIPSLQGSDRNGKVIYMGTFSKSIGASIRVSYMVLPEHLLEVYYQKCGFYASTVPKEQQKMLAAFMNQGYFERYLNKMRGIYKGKHDIFLALLKKEAWVHKIYGDYAGMHVLVEVNSKMSAEEIVEEAKKQGVRIYALEEFMISDKKKPVMKYPTLVLGYGALSEAKMREGIAVIENVLQKEDSI